MKPLHFVIIGAAKSGTTTLHHYLSRHPDICMPPEKEAPFFSRDDLYEMGWDQFFMDHFPRPGSRRLCGKATPQYMLHGAVPDRLCHAFPDAKLIVILRHPVERAHSHWKMQVRRDVETRSFEEAIEAQLKYGLVHSVDRFELSPENEMEAYVIGGLYGRILERWFDLFPRDQMLVLFTDDLSNEPLAVLRRIHEYLGVSPEFVPGNLGKRYAAGGAKRRLVARRLKEVVPRPIWRGLPKALRRRFDFWFEAWNVVPDGGGDLTEVPINICERLRALYEEDSERLEGLIGSRVPWEDLHGGRRLAAATGSTSAFPPSRPGVI